MYNVCSNDDDNVNAVSGGGSRIIQVGQLSQTNRGQSLANRPISAKSVHLTSLYGAKDISKC